MILFNMLSAQRISCQRGRQLLWKDLSFQTQAGKITFIRGANGQGKSSLLRMMAGLSSPYEGEIQWQGRALREDASSRRQISYLGHTTPLKGDLDAMNNLSYLMHIHGLEYSPQAIQAALIAWGLPLKTIRLPAKFLSQGQKQRVCLAQLHLSNSSQWILDEPFNGLDTNGAQILISSFAKHLASGGSVVLTSHLHTSIRNADIQLHDFAEEIIELSGVE